MPRLPLILLAGLLAGCSAPKAPPAIAVAPGQYAQAFDTARDTLTRYRFELERVDARAGVITTRPKSTGGLATPWDREQSTLEQAWEDLLDEQRRIVRITFEPAGPASGTPPPPPETDLREAASPLTAHVDVVIERVQHAGRRLEPSAIQLSSVTEDPALRERGLWPSYNVAFSQDPLLARRLAEAIREALHARARE
jgi:hypothetical protein